MKCNECGQSLSPARLAVINIMSDLRLRYGFQQILREMDNKHVDDMMDTFENIIKNSLLDSVIT